MGTGQDRTAVSQFTDVTVVHSAGHGLVSLKRLSVWAALSASVFAVCGLALKSDIYTVRSSVLCLHAAFCCSVALGMAIFSFTSFTASRKLSDLLESTAFLALCSGAALQVITDIEAPRLATDDRTAVVGVFIAAFAFLWASRTTRVWVPITRAGRSVQLVFGALFAAAFPLASLPYTVYVSIYSAFDVRYLGDGTAYAFGGGVSCVILAFIVVTLAGARKVLRGPGTMLAGATLCFQISWGFAILARALSSARFDGWWVCSQVMLLLAWLAMVVMAAAGGAHARKVGTDRLDELETLQGISWSLVGTNGMAEFVARLAETVREKVNGKIVAVYTPDESRRFLELAAVSVSDPEIDSATPGSKYAVTSANRFPGFHSGHTSRAFTTGEVQSARDVFIDVELVPWRVIAMDDGIAVSLPLVQDGVVAGVMDIYYGDHRELTPKRMKLLKIVAALVGPVIAVSYIAEIDDRCMDLAA